MYICERLRLPIESPPLTLHMQAGNGCRYTQKDADGICAVCSDCLWKEHSPATLVASNPIVISRPAIILCAICMLCKLGGVEQNVRKRADEQCKAKKSKSLAHLPHWKPLLRIKALAGNRNLRNGLKLRPKVSFEIVKSGATESRAFIRRKATVRIDSCTGASTPQLSAMQHLLVTTRSNGLVRHSRDSQVNACTL